MPHVTRQVHRGHAALAELALEAIASGQRGGELFERLVQTRLVVMSMREDTGTRALKEAASASPDRYGGARKSGGKPVER
ncbi:MAG: hypothetical protein ACSLFE_11600 [Gemmatimonadaceae bacterium]